MTRKLCAYCGKEFKVNDTRVEISRSYCKQVFQFHTACFHEMAGTDYLPESDVSDEDLKLRAMKEEVEYLRTQQYLFEQNRIEKMKGQYIEKMDRAAMNKIKQLLNYDSLIPSETVIEDLKNVKKKI